MHFQTSAAVIGRLLLGGMFLLAGLNKFGGLEGLAGYIASRGLPLPPVLAPVVAVFEVVAGLALIVGWQARWRWRRSRCWPLCCSTTTGRCPPSSRWCSS